MKLIVQIPCLNEEKTLPLVVQSIPKKIPGVSKIEILVIDDGSTDNTAKVAKRLGVDHIISHLRTRGLARSFATGINEAIKLGADIIVNTDADNQYPQKDIPKLIAPIMKGKADIVIANRQTDKIKHFSPLKKFFQKLGSAGVRFLSGSHVPDAVSGFRAYSRSAAIQLNIVSDFSYAIETIIQAESKSMAIATIDVNTNKPTRPSRLFKNMWEHMRHSGSTMIRIYTMFRPLVVFVSVGAVIFLVGFAFAIRFLFYFFTGTGGGHIQSVIMSAILITVGFQIAMTGLMADLIAINRKLLEDGLKRIKLIELQSQKQVKRTSRVKKVIPRSLNGQKTQLRYAPRYNKR